MSLLPEQDAYGRLLFDAFENRAAAEAIERDDGLLLVSPEAPATYFAPFRRWPAHQRRAMRFVRGRVLDVGCGAGRVTLHLQDRGHEVMAIDNSPLAIEVARRRGVRDARVLSITDVDAKLGNFDTIVMLGNNFGLFASARRARILLRRFSAMTPPTKGRIVAEALDPYATEDPDHLEYHERNRQRGRLPGQIRMRVRHRRCVTPWFDYLFVAQDELEELLEDTDWTLTRTIASPAGSYVVVLEPS